MAQAAPRTDPLLGRLINDRFRVESVIARGGMGRVYRAIQEPLGREVALKVLDPRYAGDADPDFQIRFFLEASTAAKLTHPNTVTIFDYGKTQDEIFFIAMELVEGPTLAATLKRNGALEPRRAVHIAVQIARSLREAHQLGVIHRDLKPANVILTRHGDEDSFVKVLDFGLVKDLRRDEDLTEQGLFMGSPKYMSPEQIQGGEVDERTDIYSLGVILYAMLSGRVPFDGGSQVQTLMAHLEAEVPELRRPDDQSLPVELTQLVLRCLRKDPEDRFRSMSELIVGLKEVAELLDAPVNASGSVSRSEEFDASGVRMSARARSDRAVACSYPPPPISVSEIEVRDGATGGRPRRRWLAAGVGAFLIAGAATIALTARGPDAPAPATAPPAPGPRATDTPAQRATGVQGASGEERAGESPPDQPEPRVQVVLESAPPGAEVFVGDRSYGLTPAALRWTGAEAAHGREITFRFELEGHEPMTVTRTILGDSLEVRAELERRRSGSDPRAEGAARAPMAARSTMRRRAGPARSPAPRPETPPGYRDNPY